MGKNYYINQAETQADEFTNYCVKVIEGMEESMRSIDNFRDDSILQGKTYDSAKKYVMETYYPLAKGIIKACEEIIRQNKKNPKKFRSDVANTTVIEDEVLTQIDNAVKQRQQIEDLNKELPVPLLSMAVDNLHGVEKKLKDKTEDLHTYDLATQSNWNTAGDILSQVEGGMSEISKHGKFDPKSGTFSTQGIDLYWSKYINDVWDKSEAESLNQKLIGGYFIDSENEIGYAKILGAEAMYRNVDNVGSFVFSGGALDTAFEYGGFNGFLRAMTARVNGKFGFGKNFKGIKSHADVGMASVQGGYSSNKKGFYSSGSGKAFSASVDGNNYIGKNSMSFGGKAEVVGYSRSVKIGFNLNKYFGASIEASKGVQAGAGFTYDFKNGKQLAPHLKIYSFTEEIQAKWKWGGKIKLKFPAIMIN